MAQKTLQLQYHYLCMFFFFFQAEDGIRDYKVTGVQTCALPIWLVIAGVADANAQSYPSRPITLVVPFPPGGSTDSAARIMAERMRSNLGQSIVDRKSTRLNSSHLVISYAVFCLKKKILMHFVISMHSSSESPPSSPPAHRINLPPSAVDLAILDALPPHATAN